MEKTIPNKKQCQLLMMKGLTPYTFDPQIRYAEWNERNEETLRTKPKNDIIFSY